MIVVISFRLYSFHILFLYRHGVDDYLSGLFQRVPWQTKLVDTFQSGCGPRWAANRIDRLSGARPIRLFSARSKVLHRVTTIYTGPGRYLEEFSQERKKRSRLHFYFHTSGT